MPLLLGRTERLAAIAIALALLGAHPAWAGLVLEDIRANATSLSIGGGAPEEALFGVIDGPARFDHRLFSERREGGVRVTGEAEQHSLVTGSRMEGTAFATAFGVGDAETWWAEAESAVQVLFRVEAVTTFTLRAILDVDGLGSGFAGLLGYAEVSILDPGGGRLFGDVRQADGMTEITVHDLLAPGDYFFFVDALVFAPSDMPEARPVVDIDFMFALPGPGGAGALVVWLVSALRRRRRMVGR